MNLNLTAYLPFLHPLRVEGDKIDGFRAAIEDLYSLSGKIKFTSQYSSEIVREIDVLENSSPEEDRARRHLATLSSARELDRFSRSSSIVEFSTEVYVEDDYIEGYDSKGAKVRHEGEAAERIYSLVIGNEFVEHIHRLIVAANIAHVGALASIKGILLSDGTQDIEATSNAQSLEQAAEYALSIGWPPIKDLNIPEVWNWISTKKGFMEGFGDGPTGRALNAFTHLLRPVNTIDKAPSFSGRWLDLKPYTLKVIQGFKNR